MSAEAAQVSGICIAGDEVALQELRVGQPPRRDVDEPFHDRGRFRPAGATERRRRHRIGHHAEDALRQRAEQPDVHRARDVPQARERQRHAAQ